MEPGMDLLINSQDQLFAAEQDNVVGLGHSHSRIAELHIPASNQLSRQMLLTGILRELNETDDERWVCWIADTHTPVKSFLREKARREGHHLLQVLARESSGTLPLTIRALQGGRSHTVVMMAHQPLQASEYAQLEWAARKGEAECLVIYLEGGSTQ